MEQVSNRLKAITPREVAIVFVCVLGAYLLRVRQSYDLKPAWRLDIDLEHYQNRRFAQEWEKVPAPIITDIESDGKNEVVMATHDGKLKILRMPEKQPGNLVLPYIELLNEASITTDDDAKTRRHPVSMATGYLDAYQSMIQVREQVVVVLTDDWTLLCFDHHLQLLWETQLMTIKNKRYYIKEAALTVVSHKLKSDDRGLIIVGASIGDKLHHTSTLKHEHKDKEEVKDPLKDDFDDMVEDDSKKERPVDVNHFSTFALNGQDGSMRWHHLPGDFNEMKTIDQEMFKSHHFKLGLRKGLRHEGELTWSHYTKAMLANLPHRWQGRQDTKLSLARFVRDKTKDENEETATRATIIGLEDHHLAGYHYGGLRPHHPSEHLQNPNAIVSHMNEGVEVLDLSTGRPLTRLKLTHDRSTYSDVNDDGVIDQVKGQYIDNADDEDNCVAVVRSGIPPSELLFNGSICHVPRLLDLTFLAGSLFASTNVIENHRLTVPPITVKSIAQKRGILNHLLGLNHLRWVQQGLDSIFLVSNGRVTSYGPMGHFNWQVDTTAKWSDTVTVFRSKHYFAPELVDAYNFAFVPSMQPTSLQVYGKMDAALVVGWKSMTLISLVDGRWLAEHSLPCQPDAPVVIGDLDGDGYKDYIVQCPNGLVGFHLQQFSGYWSTALICICLLVAVVGLTSLCTSDNFIFDEQDERSMQGYQRVIQGLPNTHLTRLT